MLTRDHHYFWIHKIKDNSHRPQKQKINKNYMLYADKKKKIFLENLKVNMLCPYILTVMCLIQI